MTTVVITAVFTIFLPMPVCRVGNTILAACELSVTGVIRRFKEAFDVLGLPEAGRTDKGMSILSVGTDKDLMFFGPDNGPCRVTNAISYG